MLVALLGVMGVVSAQDVVVEADPIEKGKVMAKGASMEAFLSEEFPTDDVLPTEEGNENEIIKEPKVALDPADRGVVPEIEIYGMDDDEAVPEDDPALFRFSDDGAPLAGDEDVPTTLVAPKCEDGEGLLYEIEHFFKSLFGQCTE